MRENGVLFIFDFGENSYCVPNKDEKVNNILFEVFDFLWWEIPKVRVDHFFCCVVLVA